MINKSEAEKILGVAPNTMSRWIYTNKIKAVKIGKKWKLDLEEVERIARCGL